MYLCQKDIKYQKELACTNNRIWMELRKFIMSKIKRNGVKTIHIHYRKNNFSRTHNTENTG